MPRGKCEWCNGCHDIRPQQCREIQRVQEQLESINPAIREARLQERLRELKEDRIKVRG